MREVDEDAEELSDTDQTIVTVLDFPPQEPLKHHRENEKKNIGQVVHTRKHRLTKHVSLGHWFIVSSTHDLQSISSQLLAPM